MHAAGGFAAVLARGDPTAGAVILILRDRDNLVTALTKTNRGDGQTRWDVLTKNVEEDSVLLRQALERQRRFDPDLWVVELDVANPAQFIDDGGTIC